MSLLHRSLVVLPGSRIALLLLALPAAMPAFAATFDAPLPVPTRELILLGSLVLLSVALALRIGQRRHAPHQAPDRPDMRWWKNA